MTSWIGAGTGPADAFRPALAQSYALLSWVDATNQPDANIPPSPNLFVVEITADDSVATAMAADGSVAPGILWLEGYHEPDASPGNTEYATQVAAFSAISGQSVDAIHSAIGDSPAGRTRRQIGDVACNWLQARPKA